MKKLFGKKRMVWDELSPFNFTGSKFITDHKNDILAIPNGDDMDGIYKFNEDKNKWQLHISFPQNYDFLNGNTAPIIDENNKLYAIGNRNICSVDLNTKIFNKQEKQRHYIQGNGVFIKNELHLFMGTIHYKFNQTTDNNNNQFERVPTVSILGLNESHFESNGLIYIEETEQIFIFGGKTDGRRMDSIWCYDMVKNKMIKCTQKLPHAFMIVCCYHKGSVIYSLLVDVIHLEFVNMIY